ncbi:MAG TPA: hypothetical protein VFW49_04850 [Fluviicoccus sp.]|nr:hypothetical protein [Fluviicoccus sp.]
MSNFTRHSDIMQAMPVERQERIRAKAQALQAQINLVNLRKRQKTTQRVAVPSRDGGDAGYAGGAAGWVENDVDSGVSAD